MESYINRYICISISIQSRRECTANAKAGFIYSADHHQRRFIPSGRLSVLQVNLGMRCFTTNDHIDCGVSQIHLETCRKICKDHRRRDIGTELHVYRTNRRLFNYIENGIVSSSDNLILSPNIKILFRKLSVKIFI